MGNFIDILAQIQKYNAVLEEAEVLTKFFGIVEKFNYEKPLKEALKNEIENHFEYRW